VTRSDLILSDPSMLRLQGLRRLRENSNLPRFCSARLQAGILKSSRCPPKGGRYTYRIRVLTQTLRPLLFKFPNVAAKVATHKDDV
jgi:hypothetical protein